MHILVQRSPSHALVQPKYRADIDGLRGIAVLSVVGYHAFPNLVPGGFIGVDVFFVISGFLISSIIYTNLQRDSFSFLEFYARRVRRIFPSLLLVLVAVFIVGWFWLLPDEYQQLGTYIFGGAAFFSNFVSMIEGARYFNEAAGTKPLLHLWSLGVEEQFYIVWPLLLWWTWKRRWRWMAIVIPILVASFVLNVAIADRHLSVDFFSPATRFWELLIGALLATPTVGSALSRWRPEEEGGRGWLLKSAGMHELAPVLGSLLIATGLVVIERYRLYPFTWALLPTLGAALIIGSSPHSWFNRVVLAHPALVWIGLISYPLYLWHWPLLSFGMIHEADTPSEGIRAALVALSVLLAWVTYEFVERPVRFGARQEFKAVAAVTAMLVAGLVGLATVSAEGFPSRLKSQLAIDLVNYNYFHGKTEEEFWGTKSCFNFNDGVGFYRRNGCERKEFPGRPTVFLVGDSYSAFLSPGLREYLRERKLNLFQYSVTNCFYFSMKDDRQRCLDINIHIMEMIKLERPDVLIVFGQYRGTELNPHYREGLPYAEYYLQMMRKLSTSGAGKIIFMGQIPNWAAALPKLVLRRFVRWGKPVPDRTFDGVDQEPLDIDDALKKQVYPSNVTYVSLRDQLCNSSGCIVKVGADVAQNLIVFDRGHLTHAGSVYVSRTILSKLLP